MPDFSAVYMPSLPPGREDPSRSGFATKAEAEEYMFSEMCEDCKKQRALFLSGAVESEGDDFDTCPEEYPACSCEWLIVPTDKANGTTDELYEAAGWKTVYTRPN